MWKHNLCCCNTRYNRGLNVNLSSPTSSFASRSASEATTYSSSFLPVALMRTCLVFQNFFCMRAITELSSPSRARPPLSMSPPNLWPTAQSVTPEGHSLQSLPGCGAHNNTVIGYSCECSEIYTYPSIIGYQPFSVLKTKYR